MALTFTEQQQRAQREYNEFCRGPMTDMAVLYGPLQPFYDLVDARQTRDAADFAERFEAETLGYTRYRGYYDGPVHLILVEHPIYTASGGTHFQPGELAIALLRPADQYDDAMMLAWCPRTGAHIVVTPDMYRIVETVPARG